MHGMAARSIAFAAPLGQDDRRAQHDVTDELVFRDSYGSQTVVFSSIQISVGMQVAYLDLRNEVIWTSQTEGGRSMVYRSSQTSPVFGLRREIDRLFEDTFGGGSARSGFAPPVDVREDGKEIVLEVELPGIKPSDVEVTSENGVLTIRGEKQSMSTENKDGRYHVTERSYGSFTRSFQLPSGVDERHIEAEFSDGLLLVHVPKAALAQPRRIEIRNSGNQPAIQGSAKAAGSEKPSTAKSSAEKPPASGEKRPAGTDQAGKVS